VVLVNGRPRRGQIFWVEPDPVVGREVGKMRPSVVVSPHEMNQRVKTVLVVPLSRGAQPAPFRVPVRHDDQEGQALIDQTRVVSLERLRRHYGHLDDAVLATILATLREAFML